MDEVHEHLLWKYSQVIGTQNSFDEKSTLACCLGCCLRIVQHGGTRHDIADVNNTQPTIIYSLNKDFLVCPQKPIFHPHLCTGIHSSCWMDENITNNFRFVVSVLRQSFRMCPLVNTQVVTVCIDGSTEVKGANVMIRM